MLHQFAYMYNYYCTLSLLLMQLMSENLPFHLAS